MNVIAFDPGLHIGAARKDDEYHTTMFIAGYDNPKAYYEWLDINIQQASVVVVEQFQAQVINHDGLFTVELVGAICALAHNHGCTLIRHRPSDRKRLGMEDRARAYLKKTKRKFVVHEVDALAHLFYYEVVGK